MLVMIISTSNISFFSWERMRSLHGGVRTCSVRAVDVHTDTDVKLESETGVTVSVVDGGSYR